MAFCLRCDAPVDGMPFCPVCGAAQEEPGAAPTDRSAKSGAAEREAVREEVYCQGDISENRGMAALSYLGLLCLVPYFAARTSPFAHGHAVRGMNLMLLEVGYLLLTSILNAICSLIAWQLALVVSTAFSICGLLFVGLSAIGIWTVCRGQSRSLPLVGAFRLIRS